ncbi:enoyl-CoA hydratase-related protein [Sphingomonas sp. G-3-2-10]|uniref:enoyl-CoA hydratase/isomerase family protein n=1 Tax=Sphingomonas sp. G-3-2-10 TaxID=2728838 RepID=UPI00146F3365|nr:enoyl-CoA hydratase-related protein [Sphingomonas sp. G-3-2-10]NML05460.1 enoyl-CoA hydratase/isomerase family protein [Sphingomonas sp. G-3-2-10]
MIRTDRDGHVATLTLDRPQARNALPTAGWLALADAARALAASDVRVVILRSEVPLIFSAGADITEFSGFSEGDATRFREAMRAGIEAVASLPMPSLAVVDGGCYGAAVALILACDLRVAGEGAQFAATPAKLGIGYPREDVARLSAQIGKGNAARMLFTGEIVDAADALAMGLVELRWEDAEPLARAFADRIAANAPGAMKLLKRALADPTDIALDSDFDAAFSGEEFATGYAAFRERRRPVF